jgi:hypothetical protein
MAKIVHNLLFEATFTSFSKRKSQKEVTKTVGIKYSISYYFCLMTDGSGAGYGSIPRSNGCGSGRPKN